MLHGTRLLTRLNVMMPSHERLKARESRAGKYYTNDTNRQSKCTLYITITHVTCIITYTYVMVQCEYSAILCPLVLFAVTCLYRVILQQTFF